MRLYKFRSLGSCEDYKRALEILRTGKFWCSKLWDLNDPMEGIFSNLDPSISRDEIARVFTEKNKLRICSFSGTEGFRCPKMWGYYANGFKGIAIEICISGDSLETLSEVSYENDLAHVNLPSDDVAGATRTIATTKLSCWKSENEYRFLSECTDNKQKIGTIKAVHFGDPLRDISNRDQLIDSSETWMRYSRVKEKLASKCKQRGIERFSVRVIDGSVASGPFVSD